MKKIWFCVTGVIRFVFYLSCTVAVIVGIVLGIKWCVKGFWNWITSEPKVCYYEYVDLDNNSGTAQSCSSFFGNLHCRQGDGEVAVKSFNWVCKEK